jgi:hypothetical protein
VVGQADGPTTPPVPMQGIPTTSSVDPLPNDQASLIGAVRDLPPGLGLAPARQLIEAPAIAHGLSLAQKGRIPRRSPAEMKRSLNPLT